MLRLVPFHKKIMHQNIAKNPFSLDFSLNLEFPDLLINVESIFIMSISAKFDVRKFNLFEELD